MTNRLPHTKDYGTAPTVDNDRQSWTIIELIRLVVRRWKPIAIVTAAAMAVTAVIMAIMPNYYVSTASILPSGKTDNMSALKEAVGIANSNVVDENSSILFPVVLQSRTIADMVLSKNYDIEYKGERITVVPTEYFKTGDPDELRRSLAEATSVSIDKKTGDIHLEVETKYPDLSKAVLGEYLEALDDFNVNRRKSVAKENCRYLTTQIERSRDSLRWAEDNLAEFRHRNADWLGSSNYEVISEMTRLQRELEVKSAAYVYLQQQLEMAKIDIQKDVPVVRVLDRPSMPTLKSRPRRTLSVMIAGFTAFLLTTLLLLVREYVHREKSGPAAIAYEGLRTDIRANFPRASRVLRLVERREAKETIEAGKR